MAETRRALLCSDGSADLFVELAGTVLHRGEFALGSATDLKSALAATGARPDLVVVDRDTSWAVRLLEWIRAVPRRSDLPVVITARGEFDPRELELLDAGANVVLRLPPGPDWDASLMRLLNVSVRRKRRFAVHFQVEARFAPSEPAKQGVAIDLSETGMLLEGDPLRVGTELHLAFQIPGKMGLISIRGRVVRQASPGRSGVEFTQIESAELDQIRKFCDAAS